METMRAAVVREPGKIGVETIDRPEPGPDQVLVKIHATGVCHTDQSAFRGLVPLPLPLVLGHEGAGVVEAVGPNVTALAPGDHVVLSITYGCGRCRQCQKGAFGLCEIGVPASLGGTLPDGQSHLAKDGERLNHFLCQSSFADYAVVPAACAVKIRDDAPLDVVCLLGCGAITGYGAVIRRARVAPGDSVLVIGAGGVGLAAIMAARLAGANPIIVSDINDDALALAAEVGATHTVNVSEGKTALGESQRITGGGVDFAFDTVGTSATIDEAYNALCNGGEAVAIGLGDLAAAATVPVFSLIYEKRLTGTNNGSIRPHVDIPAAVDLFMEGRLPLDRLITRRYDLDQIDTALADMEGGSGRGVITFGGAPR
ncbi:MAG TPA: alcohol dehydrogenase catalytic domain-containing protein [Acidimicrobiia bacterium]